MNYNQSLALSLFLIVPQFWVIFEVIHYTILTIIEYNDIFASILLSGICISLIIFINKNKKIDNKLSDKKPNKKPNKNKKTNKINRIVHRNERDKFQRRIYEIALKRNGVNNIINRQLIQDSYELDIFDKNVEYDITPIKISKSIPCYSCGKTVKTFHGNYVYCCTDCGNKFQKYRKLYSDQTERVSLVTGCRTKLGHQIALKLLRAGSIVIGTTRQPDKAEELFMRYDDYQDFKNRLHIYPNSLDFDNNDLELEFSGLHDYIENLTNKLDTLINCAAQTIRSRDKKIKEDLNISQIISNEKNRYGDARFAPKDEKNSWNLDIEEITQEETEEVYRINAVAPLLLFQSCLDLLKRSKQPFVINVHAREGLINVPKSSKHIHTNMAKAALAMVTRTICSKTYRSEVSNKKFSIHGCDPGWISIDEYYFDNTPWIVPPLDEVDGAARILFPLWMNYKSNSKTRRHFDKFIT